jgi:hypothetical protein
VLNLEFSFEELGMKYFAIGVAVIFLFAGCAARKQLSYEEYLDVKEEYDRARTHLFADTTKKSVIKATARVFELSDGSDFHMSYHEDAIAAYRDWNMYLVFGSVFAHEYWYLLVEQDGPDVVARARTYTIARGGLIPLGAPMPSDAIPRMVLSDDNVNPKTVSEAEINDGAVYCHLFSRMNVILGRSDDWISCDEAEDHPAVKADLETLCINAKDFEPDR